MNTIDSSSRYYPLIDLKSTPNDQIIKEFNNLICFYLNLNYYQEDEIENGFITFKRNFEPLYLSNNQNSNKENLQSDSIPISNPTSNTNISPNDNKKQIFLCHYYKELPKDINYDFFKNQITFYIKKPSNSLSYIQGFSFTNKNGHTFPIALTKRPTNGPLISLFSKKNQNDDRPNKGQNNDHHSPTFSAEEKFEMILEIIQGIAFIHKNNFIHSNLNPTTVYLNENYEPIICDYLFIPTYSVKFDNDKKQFKFSIDRETASKIYEKTVYVAPEILSGGEFGQPADIFSLGMIMYFILTEEEPVRNEKTKEIKYPDGFSEKWKKIIDGCTADEVTKRLKLEDLLTLIFDEKNATSLISSITPKSTVFSKISEETEMSLKNIHDKISCNFNEKAQIFIFREMIPNFNEIDDKTKRLISYAEMGQTKAIEKVADLFHTGKNNFFRDDVWSFKCYEFASQKSVYSLIKLAEYYENGIGTDINLTESNNNYNLALNHSEISEIEREKIKEKIDKNDKLKRSIKLINIPLDNEINLNFKNIESIETSQDEKYKQIMIRFKRKTDLEKAKKIIKKQEYEYETFNKQHLKTNRFDSLKEKTEIQRFFFEDFELINNDENESFLGGGTFGNTYKVKNKKTNEILAAKVSTNPLLDSEINGFKREIIMASKVKNHPAIVKYVGFNEYNLFDYIENNKSTLIMPTLFMEFIPGGNLDFAIEKKPIKFWNDTIKLKIIIGIASGLAEMNKHNIVHRDLKPLNILLNDKFEPIICDFGYARQLSEEEENNQNLTKEVGTRIYMALELYNFNLKRIYNYKVDSYSFAIIMYQVLKVKTSKFVYPQFNLAHVVRCKIENYVPPIDDLSDAFKFLINSCWNNVIDERLTPSEIYEFLVDKVNREVPILPDIDFSDVKEYISRLENA